MLQRNLGYQDVFGRNSLLLFHPENSDATKTPIFTLAYHAKRMQLNSCLLTLLK